VLAGYKPLLWPLTLRRIAIYAPSDASSCVVTAGKKVDELAALCKANSWTYISVRENKTGLALNKAIAAHPASRWIFKIDEDIFVSKDFFTDMRNGYESIVADGQYRPGFCAPTLNVNGISYISFLEKLEKSSEYFKKFGELRAACDGVHAHYDPIAALWIWKLSLPFDEIAARFRDQAKDTVSNKHLIGTRFSIGAILLERSFLDQIGGFRSSWRQKMLGVDEAALCMACVEHSRPMFYLSNVLAGHFSFYPQEHTMLEALPRLAELDPVTFN